MNKYEKFTVDDHVESAFVVETPVYTELNIGAKWPEPHCEMMKQISFIIIKIFSTELGFYLKHALNIFEHAWVYIILIIIVRIWPLEGLVSLTIWWYCSSIQEWSIVLCNDKKKTMFNFPHHLSTHFLTLTLIPGQDAQMSDKCQVTWIQMRTLDNLQ